jgi:hypothetical protein
MREPVLALTFGLYLWWLIGHAIGWLIRRLIVALWCVLLLLAMLLGTAALWLIAKIPARHRDKLPADVVDLRSWRRDRRSA